MSNSGYEHKILGKFASVPEHWLELRATLFFHIKMALAKGKQKYIEKKIALVARPYTEDSRRKEAKGGGDATFIPPLLSAHIFPKSSLDFLPSHPLQ